MNEAQALLLAHLHRSYSCWVGSDFLLSFLVDDLGVAPEDAAAVLASLVASGQLEHLPPDEYRLPDYATMRQRSEACDLLCHFGGLFGGKGWSLDPDFRLL